MDDELRARLRVASRGVTQAVGWHQAGSPAEVLRGLADACDELGLEAWDSYGEDGPVARLEAEVAELLGTEAAAYFPSGIMAQQAALRVWCDRSGSRRVALPDLSHLLAHELDGPRLLHGFEVEALTTGAQVPTAAALAAVPGRLGAVLVELPLREAGCLLPTWEELSELSLACRERGVPLHVDGARIWESQPFYGRPLPEIVALCDTIYVSFYKGLGGLAGACLAGSADVLDEARRWRKRMGGTLIKMTPETVSALVGLRDRLPLMGRLVAWAQTMAAALPETVTVAPGTPQTNTFLLYAAGDPDALNRRLLDFVETRRIVPCPPWRPAVEPGRMTTEVAVSDAALGLDPVEVAGWIGELVASATMAS